MAKNASAEVAAPEQAVASFDEVVALRGALQAAKDKLVDQNNILRQLTSPPFAYATVVATSLWTARSPFGRTFSDLHGRYTNIDTNIGHLNEYGLGDKLRLHKFDHMREDIINAKEHVVVGFSDNEVVIQLDGAHVIAIDADAVRNFYNIEEKAERITAPTAVIVIEGKLLEVFLPKDVSVEPGDTVSVSMETSQIVAVSEAEFGGTIAFVRNVVDDEFCEVDYESSTRVVFCGKFTFELEKGDRVVLDASGMVIVRNLGKEDDRFSLNHATDVTWESIGGLANAKRTMIEIIELPHRNPEVFKFYGKKPVKGVLLSGPPGCGKTMLGKAAATALANIYNNDDASSTGFIYIKGPEILDRYVGASEATIRQIFARARKHKEEYGYPAVVFIDEADAILGKRGSGISSDIERTIVPMFLNEMDGLEDSGALVILATNRPDILDPAVVRDGRIDRKIVIERPTLESATEIFRLNLDGVPLSNGYTHEGLAEIAATELFSNNRTFYTVELKDGSKLAFDLHHIVNGGMIASVVDQATSIAIQRDLENKQKPQGISKADLVAAVDAVQAQNRHLNHTEELSEFVHDFRDEVAGIHRLSQSAA